MSIYGAEGFHGIIYGAEEFLGAPNLVPIMPRDLNLQTFHLNIHPCFFSFFHPHKYYIYIFSLFSDVNIFIFFPTKNIYIYYPPVQNICLFFRKKIYTYYTYIFIYFWSRIFCLFSFLTICRELSGPNDRHTQRNIFQILLNKT